MIAFDHHMRLKGEEPVQKSILKTMDTKLTRSFTPKPPRIKPRRVVIEVFQGVAHLRKRPRDVDVEIIDLDARHTTGKISRELYSGNA